MSTVSSQIRRAINETISDQILPQIQATLKFGQRHTPERRWQDSVGRSEQRSEEALDSRLRSDSRDDYQKIPNRNEDLESTHDMVTGDNESPNNIPEFLKRTNPNAICTQSTPS